MSIPKLMSVLLWGALLASPAAADPAGEAVAESLFMINDMSEVVRYRLEYFDGGVFTPHTDRYDSLACHWAFRLHPVFRLGIPDSLSEEDRWRFRVQELSVACSIARTDEELIWFKRALEIAYWRFAHLAAVGAHGQDPDVERILKLDELPPFIGPEEVDDLLTIHDVLSSVEDTASTDERDAR